MRPNKLLIGCGIAIIAVLVIAIAGVVAGSLLIPDVNQQIPSGDNTVFVNITQPVNGASVPVNQPMTIYVEAFGDRSIKSVKLLVNGVQVPDGSSSPAGEEKLISSWTFTPDKEGSISLLASAISDDELESVSNVVYFQVVALDEMSLALVEGGTTPAEVVSDEIGLIQPEDGVSVPPPPGFDELGNGSPPPPFPEENDQNTPEEPAGQPGKSWIPIKYSLWADMMTKDLFGTKDPPEAPKIDGGSKLCEGILVVEDNSTNEVGFNLYRLDPGSSFFVLAATLESKAGKSTFSYHDPGLANGLHFYRLSAFNSAGETKGNIIPIQIESGQCVNPVYASLTFDSFKLTTKTPVEKVYCYISAGGPWWRVPEDANSFIQASNGVFDLNPYLGSIPSPKPPQTSVTINIQCWGWNGSTLVYLGASQQTWNPFENLELVGSLFEIIGSSNGEQQWMKGDMPDTDLIAPPYDVFISKDPKYCKDHVPPGAGNVQQCENYMIAHKIMMFWTWSRYGNCYPGAEICDMKYQPKDGFRAYVISDGELKNWLPLLAGNYTYVPVMQLSQKDEYFVTAYSNEFGEFFDSNHVTFPYVTKELVVYPALEEIKFEILNDGSGALFSKYTSIKPDELITGYSYFCSNPNCNNPPYPEWRFFGNANFTLPENLKIQNAWLEWNTEKYITDIAGTNDVLTSCGVHLDVHQEGDTTNEILSTSSLLGTTKFDVSTSVKKAVIFGKKTIEFRFTPPQKQAGVNWNRCLWYINNVSLKIQYFEW